MSKAPSFETTRGQKALSCFAVAVVVTLCALTGCGPRNFINENDKLRAENLELKSSIEELESQLKNREGELDAARQQLAGPESKIEGAELPVFSSLWFDRFTGFTDTDRDGEHDTLRVFLRPFDQDGRFLPMAGKATVSLVRINPDSDPQIVARQSFDAKTFKASYRESFMSSHFTLELPVDSGKLQSKETLIIQVVATEATTGIQHRYERPIEVN